MTASRLTPGKLPHALLERLLRAHTDRDPRLIVAPALGEDAAVIDLGDRYLVAKTDPITFATDAIGQYAVHVNANDIAAMGATPRYFLATVLLPAGAATAELAESVLAGIHAAARELGILVCGGHTEITPTVSQPVVVGQMLGDVLPSRLVRSSGLRPGHVLILTKGLAIEAAAVIARERAEDLNARHVPAAVVRRAARFLEDPGISVVRDARLATEAGGVSAMHDPTEGGVATGLYEMARASGVGLEIRAEALPIAPEAERLCAAFGLDPLGALTSGALLIGCTPERADAVVAALEGGGVPAAKIGHARDREHGLRLRWADQSVELPTFAADEITRLFGA